MGDAEGRSTWVRRWVDQHPLGRLIGRPDVPLRYLDHFDRMAQTHQYPFWRARLWVAPDELRTERMGEVHGWAGRAGAIGISLEGWDPVSPRLTVLYQDGSEAAVAKVPIGPEGSMAVREAMAIAGWPTDKPTATPWAVMIPPGSRWILCRVGGSTGWFVVEPGAIGVEVPGAVGWWTRALAPQVLLHAEGADEASGMRVEVRAAGAPPLVAEVPYPGCRSLAAALDAGGWLGSG